MAGSRRLNRLGSAVVARVGRSLENTECPLVVALSGGADSAVLAWAVRQDGREARAVHVHHGWPGSDRMEAAATAVAGRLEMDLERVRVDTSGPGSAEAVARAARYRALDEQVRTGERIVTGHTQTDQAETVLGNLVWGAGLDGLRGIHRYRNALIRPMLDVTRDETRELATLLRLPFVDDPANDDDSFRRVRIRRALALWEGALAPGIGLRLADLARLVETDVGFLDALGAEVRVEKSEGSVRVPAAVLRTLPRAVAGRVVRRALRVVGSGYPGTRRDVERVLAVADGGAPTLVTGGHPVARIGAHVRIGDGSRQPEVPGLLWDVKRSLRWGTWTWKARECAGRPDAYPFSAWCQVFDLGVFGGREAVVRRVAPDDRLAMRRGRKRASDAMAEAGIPRRDRDNWPVLEVDGRATWIPGVRRAYVGWVTGGTMGYVLVSATREETWKPVGC